MFWITRSQRGWEDYNLQVGDHGRVEVRESCHNNCRMITGDEVLTSGQSFIGTISLSHHRAQYLQSIGYCPQFDSIIEVRRSSGGIILAADCDTTPQVLTGREMLTLFARIRGLRTTGGVIRREIEKLAEFVDLTEYLDRQSGLYSGGRH